MMKSKSVHLLCIAVLACAVTGAAAAATVLSTSLWDPDETAPTVDDVASAATRATTTHCRTSSCGAIVVIHEMADILQYEFGDANGVASLYLGNRPQIAGHRLDRTLLNHPELYGSVCATGAKLISRAHAEAGVMFIPVLLLVNSVDMDLRDHGHCARDLAAALPKDFGNDQIQINARDLCVAGVENHHRPKTACAVLMQGVREKQ